MTAYGSTPAACRTGGWTASGSDVLVTVDCYSLAGSLVDTYFTASFSSDTAESPTLDYVWANNPSPRDRFDLYARVQFPVRLSRQRGYGNPDRHGSLRCQLARTGDGGGIGQGQHLQQPGDQLPGRGLGGRVSWSGRRSRLLRRGRFARRLRLRSDLPRGEQPARGAETVQRLCLGEQRSAASYTPAKPYQYSSANAVNTVSRSGVGVYTVELPGLGRSVATGDVQVTAYGSTNDFCQVGSWSSSGSNELVTVRCFDPAGAPPTRSSPSSTCPDFDCEIVIASAGRSITATFPAAIGDTTSARHWALVKVLGWHLQVQYPFRRGQP